MSIGFVSSYRLGARSIIIPVPTTHASVNIHRNILSSTIATYFQSSSTCKHTIFQSLFNNPTISLFQGHDATRIHRQAFSFDLLHVISHRLKISSPTRVFNVTSFSEEPKKKKKKHRKQRVSSTYQGQGTMTVEGHEVYGSKTKLPKTNPAEDKSNDELRGIRYSLVIQFVFWPLFYLLVPFEIGSHSHPLSGKRKSIGWLWDVDLAGSLELPGFSGWFQKRRDWRVDSWTIEPKGLSDPGRNRLRRFWGVLRMGRAKR